VNTIDSYQTRPLRILVTGASSGIGARTAARLAADGHHVVGAARRVRDVASLPGVAAVHLDLESEESITAAARETLEAVGPIDVLINNAGYGEFGSIEETPLDHARRQFQVNLFGLTRLTQLVLTPMRERGSGRIVNVSSLAGEFSSPLGGWYHASKFALEGLSDSLRLEVSPFGIDVVVVQPGPVRTPWHDEALQQLTDTSGKGPYAEMAAAVSRYHRAAQDSAVASDPDAVATVIVTAATTRKPRTRYRVGRGAGLAVALSRLPDRVFDAMTRSQFRLT
jgi:short-subunit dehydrogenase